jgi:hypothetical protein
MKEKERQKGWEERKVGINVQELVENCQSSSKS